MTTKFIDLTGKKIGNWQVIKRGPNDSQGKVRWECKCKCEEIHLVQRSSLRNGRSKGCQKCSKRSTIHGKSRSKTYRVWGGIIERCYDSNHKHYKHYGARGIKMCDAWRTNFLNFLDDMGEKPKGLSIDRIDNNKGYYKENCRWANIKTQNRNRRNYNFVGKIIKNWKIIKRLENREHTIFQCIICKKIIKHTTYNIKHKAHHCNRN